MIIAEYEIRQKATNLLKVHNFDTSTAIDIKELITSTGKPITIKITDLKGISGFTCHNAKNNSYRMFFDETLIDGCPARLNFTAAHELGHIILGHFANIDNSLTMNYKKEREANIFVDELLMPTISVMQYKLCTNEIAMIYDVSITAAHNKVKYISKNAIYIRERAKEYNYKVLRNSLRLRHDDYCVQYLHENWLDPDFSPL